MAKVCEVCGKGAVYGQSIQHKHSTGWARRAPRTKRTWKVSLKDIKIEESGKAVKKTVCLKCYKRIAK